MITIRTWLHVLNALFQISNGDHGLIAGLRNGHAPDPYTTLKRSFGITIEDAIGV